ncbi:MAG: acetolactate synthase [Gammaproteobacteria bacterium]|nr:MAG: acetolactate synthase [Gammaproteobacteria bacterium]
MKLNGGEVVARTLVDLHVTHLFALCGGHISPILTGCNHQGIRVIDVRHEANAVFAADATARVTGIPGVAAVTAGPGVANTITAIKNAQLAQSPLVLLGGASATVLRGRGSLQDIDQIKLIGPHVKYATSVTRVREIEIQIKKAFKIAREGVPGPVFVELPIDLLYPKATVKEWYGIKGNDQAAGSLGKKAIQMYLNFHTQQMFKEPGLPQFASHIATGLTDTVTDLALAGKESLQNQHYAQIAAEWLTSSQRPVMVLGSQSTLDHSRLDSLIHAIEHLSIPVYLSGMARGLLGKDHPLQLRHKRKNALKQADLVILVGVPCDFRLDYGNHISYNAKLVAANLSREDLHKNRNPNLAVNGNPAQFIEYLAKALPAGSNKLPHNKWLKQLQAIDAQRNLEINEQAKAESDLINPLDLLNQLNQLLPDDSIIVADGGDFVGTAAYILQPRAALTWLDPGVFGTLGVGGGFALGAALHNPDSEVWLIYGDGSSAFSIAEFDTFARHGIGVIALIGNDARWNQIARDQVEILKDDIGTVLRHTDYHTVAEGFGGVGLLLNDPNKIEATLKQAQQLTKQGKPVLVNAILATSDFRKGSISV